MKDSLSITVKLTEDERTRVDRLERAFRALALKVDPEIDYLPMAVMAEFWAEREAGLMPEPAPGFAEIPSNDPLYEPPEPARALTPEREAEIRATPPYVIGWYGRAVELLAALDAEREAHEVTKRLMLYSAGLEAEATARADAAEARLREVAEELATVVDCIDGSHRHRRTEYRLLSAGYNKLIAVYASLFPEGRAGGAE